MKPDKLDAALVAIGLAFACSILLGCSRQTSQTSQTSTESLPDLSNRAQQELAQAYFRLGVSISCNVILKHQVAGEKIPPPEELLSECIQQDIETSKGRTLLKAH